MLNLTMVLVPLECGLIWGNNEASGVVYRVAFVYVRDGTFLGTWCLLHGRIPKNAGHLNKQMSRWREGREEDREEKKAL